MLDGTYWRAGRGALKYFPEETISRSIEFISFDKIATQVEQVLDESIEKVVRKICQKEQMFYTT